MSTDIPAAFQFGLSAEPIAAEKSQNDGTRMDRNHDHTKMCVGSKSVLILDLWLSATRLKKRKKTRKRKRQGEKNGINSLTIDLDRLKFNSHQTCPWLLAGDPQREGEGLSALPNSPCRVFPHSQCPGAGPPDYWGPICALTNIDISCKEDAKKSGVRLIFVFIFPFSSIN